MALVLGCQQDQPRPDVGMAAAQVRVIARPKAGVAQSFQRVPVYDVAPQPAAASGTAYERVDYSRLADIIVWLEPSGGTGGAPAETKREVDIDPAKPSSSIRPASVGQTIVIRNVSSRPLALYSVSDGNEFEMEPLAPGTTGSFAVKSEGLIELLADPAKPPVAQLYAAPSPWVKRARSGETITFNNVPPGQYQAVAWHPRLPGSSADLTLVTGQTGQATVTIGVNALAASQPE